MRLCEIHTPYTKIKPVKYIPNIFVITELAPLWRVDLFKILDEQFFAKCIGLGDANPRAPVSPDLKTPEFFGMGPRLYVSYVKKRWKAENSDYTSHTTIE